ncbi:MAG: SRPBCC family protein, partial [Rubrobacteraceae bacterium]
IEMAKAQTEAMDKLKGVSSDLLKGLGDKAISTVGDKVNRFTDKLEGIADDGPVAEAVKKGGEAAAAGKNPAGGAIKGALSGVKDKVTGGSGGGGGGGGKATKSTNIVETIDVGVPVNVAYNQWTEFADFPSFMKKVESVEAQDETKLAFKAQIFLSHRTWEATILEQVPDERIVWRSKGKKGHVDGAVTFHELGANLTRILVVLEYYPQGFFEKTGNIWEAQGRRARAELRHFRRHVMTRTLLAPDEVEGWRGEIRDSEVVRSHDEVVEDEEAEAEEAESEEGQSQEGQSEYDESDAPEDTDGYDDESAEPDESYEDAPEDEAPEDDYEEEPEEEAPEDDYEEEPEDEEDYEEAPEEEAPEDRDEYVEEEEEPEPPRRRRRAS